MQAQLIEDLLDMSRITSGKLRLDIQRLHPASVVEAAVETVRTAADAKGIRLEKFIDPSAGPISARSGAPAAGDVEPAVERDQVHADAAARCRCCCSASTRTSS